MASKSKGRTLVLLVSSLGTGYSYVRSINPRNNKDKMQLKKYDPRARKHALFTQKKIK